MLLECGRSEISLNFIIKAKTLKPINQRHYSIRTKLFCRRETSLQLVKVTLRARQSPL